VLFGGMGATAAAATASCCSGNTVSSKVITLSSMMRLSSRRLRNGEGEHRSTVSMKGLRRNVELTNTMSSSDALPAVGLVALPAVGLVL
jgi:hypothetical protein